MDLGRDVALMKQVSEATGVNFICCTGCCWTSPAASGGATRTSSPTSGVREVEEGIDGTGIKAGIIKVATSDPITEHEELMLRASARTHLRTGIPITTHTPPMSRVGERQVAILTEEGVEPQNIYVGHINQTLDPDYHRELARLGGGAGHQQRLRTPPPAAVGAAGRVPQNLLDEGIESNMMLSHDWTSSSPASARPASPAATRTPTASCGSATSSSAVDGAGNEAGTIDRMMIENPRRHFESVKPGPKRLPGVMEG